MLINKERVYKALREKNALQRFLARHFLFGPAQLLGFHLVADHFYELYPNTRQLAGNYDEGPRALPGIDLRQAECEARAVRLLGLYGAEFQQTTERFGFTDSNFYFRGLDALMLYVILRDLKPAKLVEIGQGYSTRVALAALERNAADTGTRPLFVSVDPYPRFVAKEIPTCITLELLEKPIQQVAIGPLIRECGFLFVDSSHVFKSGSDVELEFATIYPALPSGVVVHLHDIFTPYNYPLSWALKLKRFWNEQYFLECFLAHNTAFEVYLPLHLLEVRSELLKETIRLLKPDPRVRYIGQSFYIRRV